MPTTEWVRERLVSDLKSVIADAEELLRVAADQAGDDIAALLDRARQRLGEALRSLEREERALLAKTRQRAREAGAYVRENPWHALGIAAGIGLILLALLSRRDQP